MDRRGVHLLRDLLFQCRVYHSVLVGHNVEVWLLPPCRGREQGFNLIRTADLALGRKDEMFFLRRQVLREVLCNSLVCEHYETACIRTKLRVAGSRRILAVLADHRLSLVGSECCYIDETGDLWIIPGFGNHSSPVGMSDEKHAAVLKCQQRALPWPHLRRVW